MDFISLTNCSIVIGAVKSCVIFSTCIQLNNNILLLLYYWKCVLQYTHNHAVYENIYYYNIINYAEDTAAATWLCGDLGIRGMRVSWLWWWGVSSWRDGRRGRPRPFIHGRRRISNVRPRPIDRGRRRANGPDNIFVTVASFMIPSPHRRPLLIIYYIILLLSARREEEYARIIVTIV